MGVMTFFAMRIIEDEATYGPLGLPMRDDGWGLLLALDEEKRKVTGITDDVGYVRMMMGTEYDAADFEDGAQPVGLLLPDEAGRFRWIEGHIGLRQQ